MPYGYIYIVENLINGKAYVGYTKHPERRKFYHLNGKSNCPALRSAVRKYGSENFDFCLLEGGSTDQELKEKEIYWIAALNTTSPNGYNLTFGGEGLVATDEVRKKLSISLKGNTCSKGRVLSDEHKRRISEAQRGSKSHLFGTHPSEETRKKLRESATGRKLSDRHRQILREMNLGKKMADETKQKLRIAKLGGKHSEEHKAKIRASIQLWWDERRK